MLPRQVREILTKLNTAGFEAYAVGGCVRDLLRGVEPQDYDICTSALPEEIEGCFPDVRVIETGLKHGTVTLLVEGRPYEVTTYRSDGAYSDGRHPDSVEFVSDLTEDLARRDFTMNAMAMDVTGAVTDPFGGADDLKKGVIRCVGEPDRRFQEDGLRLLRCLRFSATLGYAIDEETGAALRRNLAMLDKVAAERVNTELCKLLLGEGCAEVLRTWPEVFCRFWPELEAMLETPQENPYHCFGVWEHTLHALEAAPGDLTVRLAVLLHDVGKPKCRTVDERGIDHFYDHPALGARMADGMLRAMKFDNATRERVVTLVAHHDTPVPTTEKSVRRWLGRLGEETFFQLLAVKRCDTVGHTPEIVPGRLAELDALEALARQVIAQGQCFMLRDLAVDGNDVVRAAGIAPGPKVGEILSGLLDRVVAGELENDREILLEEVKKSAAQ